MDSIEAARRRAASIHRAAVSAGADPWNPLRLVLDEVDRAGLAAEPVEPGGSQLDGALAKFLPEVGLILYTARRGSFEQAFLVAHELGHALLGDHAGSACEIDVERAAEAAADAEDRVVAHGPRQRRERQMDMFARELLMPREWVRGLHLDGGMSAAAISERNGAPYATVAQQLLDALLLPEVDYALLNDHQVRLNPGQLAAVQHRGAPYLLEAGPGTGKTQALVARVASLLSEGVDPRRILVLTFSNKAAGELSARIAAEETAALDAMWIGTFHAFGYDVIHTEGERVGLSSRPRLLDRLGAIELLEHELAALPLRRIRNTMDPAGEVREVLKGIDRARDEACGPEQYGSLAEAALARAQIVVDPEGRAEAIERAERQLDVARVYARYEELKRDRDLVDLPDLVCLALTIVADPASSFRGRYDHVLVDEYQDVNRASVLLLNEVAGNKRGLWAVGDARQSIYRFRGASSRSMTRYGIDHPGASFGQLTESFRSVPEVVDLVSAFGRDMVRVGGEGDPPAAPFEPLVPTRPLAGVRPELQVVRDGSRLSAAIAETIEASRAGGARYADHCVLVSGNDRLAELAGELEALEIPVLFLGSVFERTEVRDLLCLLSLVCDRWGAGLLRTSCMPEFGMDLAETVAVMDRLRAEDLSVTGWLEGGGLDGPGISDLGRASLVRLGQAMLGHHADSDPWRVLCSMLLDRTRIAARLAGVPGAAGAAAALAVWQFLNHARVGRDAGGLPRIAALLHRVRRLVALGDDRELRQLPAAAAGIDAVRMMTIHGAKGLEFGTVHLPGLEVNTMPSKGSFLAYPPPDGVIGHSRGDILEEFAASRAEEQDCLFYVAISRASDRLHLYRCSHTTDGKSRAESPFVERVRPWIDERVVHPSKHVPEPPSCRPVPLDLGPMRLAAWQLETYRKRCPRRFLYVHVLGTGGTGVRTPHRMLHDAVRNACADLARQERLPTGPEMEDLADQVCARFGEHPAGLVAELRRAALELVHAYVHGRRESAGPQLRFTARVGDDLVEASSHEVILGDDGRRIVRIVETGHFRSKRDDALDVRAVVVEASRLEGAEVHLLHLSDRRTTVLKPKRGGDVTLDRMLAESLTGVRKGLFPARPDPRRCPNCPAFLVCDALPPGSLRRKGVGPLQWA